MRPAAIVRICVPIHSACIGNLFHYNYFEFSQSAFGGLLIEAITALLGSRLLSLE